MNPFKLLSLWTDSKDRPAIEALLGSVCVVMGLLYSVGVFGHADPVILGWQFGTGTGLLITNTAGNTALDSQIHKLQQQSPLPPAVVGK